jgi:hypothetical protein
LLLLFADGQVTILSANMLTFIPCMFFICLGRSLMYILNNIVLETASCGRPIFYFLYFDSASFHCTLTHLCARNLPNQLN